LNKVAQRALWHAVTEHASIRVNRTDGFLGCHSRQWHDWRPGACSPSRFSAAAQNYHNRE